MGKTTKKAAGAPGRFNEEEMQAGRELLVRIERLEQAAAHVERIRVELASTKMRLEPLERDRADRWHAEAWSVRGRATRLVADVQRAVQNATKPTPTQAPPVPAGPFAAGGVSIGSTILRAVLDAAGWTAAKKAGGA